MRAQFRKIMPKTKKKDVTIIARWPRLLGIEEAAEYLSIAPKSIRNGLGRKAPCPFPVRHKKYGRRILFDRQDLDAYVDSLVGHE